MTKPPIPLSVLDLIPITSGSTPAEAIANALDLAKQTEAAGYLRYWVAEHHLNPGVAGTTPSLMIALIANVTATIRVGSGAVLMGHQTPLSVVEQFGILAAVHPGRIDLGVGRSGARRLSEAAAQAKAAQKASGEARPPRPSARTTEKGLVLPPPFSLASLLKSPRFAVQARLLQQPNAETPDYAEQVDDILALLNGTYRSADGTEAHVTPGEHADLELWVLGSTGGDSATVAGERGLPFAGNYHVSPASVLEAVGSYRAAFRPSSARSEPHVAVSADVVVAETDEEARELATGYALWVHSIRSAAGAIPFPSPEEAREHDWTDEEQVLVQDRLDTQFVGSASRVADQLEILAAETGADELVITTITHDHEDRVRSYQLLANEWSSRSRVLSPH